jgi:casein kinase II subunit beta
MLGSYNHLLVIFIFQITVLPIGLAKLYSKYLQGVFGNCPRALCDRQRVLPVGFSDILRSSRVKMFCPRCEETYLPKYKNINIDGAYFGTNVAHIFMSAYPNAVILPPKVYYYQPQIFGFKVFGKKGSKYYEPE